MPRKPTDPRPDRRYVPLTIDMKLDPFRSASAFVGAPSFSILPANLATMLTDAVRELQNQPTSRQGQSPAVAPLQGSPVAPDRTIQARETAGGFQMAAPELAAAPAPVRATAGSLPISAFTGIDDGLQFSAPTSSSVGGGALPGRGGSGASRPSQSSAGAQTFSGQSGSSSYFSSGFYPVSPQQSPGSLPTPRPAATTAATRSGGQTPTAAQTQSTATTQTQSPAGSSTLSSKSAQPNPANQPGAPTIGPLSSAKGLIGPEQTFSITTSPGSSGSSGPLTSFGPAGSGPGSQGGNSLSFSQGLASSLTLSTSPTSTRSSP
jgi:hypothetical protein